MPRVVIAATAAYAGPGTRDPLRILGRTSDVGTFDLPLPDVLPLDGLLVTFTREGFRSMDLRLTEGDVRDGVVLRDVELVRE